MAFIFMKLEELREKRDKEITGFFWLGLQIAFIFGIPAFIAVVIGRKLVNMTGQDFYLTLCLIFSFVISWIFVIYLYKKKSKKLNSLEKEIKRIKENKD